VRVEKGQNAYSRRFIWWRWEIAHYLDSDTPDTLDSNLIGILSGELGKCIKQWHRIYSRDSYIDVGTNNRTLDEAINDNANIFKLMWTHCSRNGCELDWYAQSQDDIGWWFHPLSCYVFQFLWGRLDTVGAATHTDLTLKLLGS
jgi:hypothetical protein